MEPFQIGAATHEQQHLIKDKNEPFAVQIHGEFAVRVMVFWSSQCILRVPEPLPSDSPETLFAESRAFNHIRSLTEEVADRQVGSAGYKRSAQYLVAYLEGIKRYIDANRPDLVAEVVRERASGVLDQSFLENRFLNHYKNLTNVVFRIAPRQGNPAVRSLLLAAHFDSTFGSPGASDALSCVAVCLEAARALAHNPAFRLAAPLLILLNGGEETLLQAAHGYMSSGTWATEIGAFINLESTGADGPDLLFQHAGASPFSTSSTLEHRGFKSKLKQWDWTIQAYKRGAVYPRGSVVAQDVFDKKVMPAATDYEIFHNEFKLPGLDIAFLLGAQVYHSSRDTWQRIRPGTVQVRREDCIPMSIPFPVLVYGQRGFHNTSAAQGPSLGVHYTSEKLKSLLWT
eukprot:jgi/Botrbrau1/6567/Bobra.40_2s0031.1